MRRRIGTALRLGSLTVLALIWLAPAYLLVVNASKPRRSYTSSTVWQPPETFALWENLLDAWERADLGISLFNTVVYSTMGPMIAVVIGAAAGFAIATLRLRRGFLWFMVIFGGSIFPLQMILIPLFIGYARTGLYDSRIGMVVVYTAISVPFSAFVMRNFFTNISYELFEAASLDRASPFRVFWQIYLPLAKTALGAIFILQFTFVWNDLLLGLTLTRSDAARPLMPALTGLQSTYSGSAMTTVLAGGLMISIPTIIVFLSAQRLFAKGLSLGRL